MWNQVYDTLNNQTLSTIAAALPVVTLLVLRRQIDAYITSAQAATH